MAPAGKATTPAQRATPAKRTPKAPRAFKVAAAEVAPAIVEPDKDTVPDEPAVPTPDPQAAATNEAATSKAAAATTTNDVTTPSGDANVLQAPRHTPAVPLQRTPAPAALEPNGDTPTSTEAWARILADPGHSPELLALAAVQTLGPRAAAWARQIRDAYPTAGKDAVARLAAQQFTRFGSVSSLFAAVAGSYAPLAQLGTSALTQAEISLHIAAAYGLNPADESRAVDLLVLSQVHPSREDAETALAAAKAYSYDSTGLTDAGRRLGTMLTVQAGAWAATRVVNRYFPGTSLLVAALSSRAAARTSAARATLFYSQVSQLSGSSV